MFLCSALVCVVGCLYWYWKIKFPVINLEPPILPGGWPLIGHVLMLFGDKVDLWKTMQMDAYKSIEFGGVITTKFMHRKCYIITDPDDSLTVANSCLEKDVIYKFGKEWLGNGLGIADVPTWKVKRRLLTPAFSLSVVDEFVEVFNSQARLLVERLEPQSGMAPFDVWPYVTKITLETIFLTVFGCTLDDEYEECAKAIWTMLEIMTKRASVVWLQSDLLFSLSRLKLQQDAALKYLHKLSNSVVQRRKAKLYNDNNTEQSKGEKFKVVLDFFLELAHEKGVFTEENIREEIDTIIFTGHDTIPSSLMFTLIMIGTRKDVQEKVFKEIQKVLGGSGNNIEREDISKLEYTEAAIKESIRLYPVTAGLARHVDKEVKLKNYTLSAGSTALLAFYGTHRHPVWGEDRFEYKPERWLEPDKLPRSAGAFAAFSIGKRNCIAKNYAMMFMKIAMVHLLRRYQISADSTKLELCCDLILKPISGHDISLKRRN